MATQYIDDQPSKNGLSICGVGIFLFIALAIPVAIILKVTHVSHALSHISRALLFWLFAAFVLFRMHTLKRDFRVRHHRIVWTAAGLSCLCGLLWFASAFAPPVVQTDKTAQVATITPPPPQSQSSPQKEPTQTAHVEPAPTERPSPQTGSNYMHDSLNIHGRVLRVGMTADDAFDILRKDEEAGPPATMPDPNVDGGLIVVHSYNVGGELLSVEFEKQDQDGPYTIVGIMSNQQD